MEKWRVHKLIDTNEETGEKLEIGGGIVRMQIGAVNGSLHTINVSPVSVERDERGVLGRSICSFPSGRPGGLDGTGRNPNPNRVAHTGSQCFLTKLRESQSLNSLLYVSIWP